MELEGKIWKDGKFWIVEVPAINVCTQGFTRKEALLMIEDAIKELIFEYFKTANADPLIIEILDYEKRKKSTSFWVYVVSGCPVCFVCKNGRNVF